MTPAPVGYQCPICTGRAREGAFGAASYRTRTTVSRQADRVPLVKMIRGAGVTQVLIAINVAIFIAMLTQGRISDVVLRRFGALPPVLAPSQWWRLFTAMFVHLSLIHILFNMWALTIFGPPVEERYGRARFLGLYLTAGLLGNAASLMFTAGGFRAGASGGVFGILGAWIGFFVRHHRARGAKEQLRSLFILVAINLFIGYWGGAIDNNAHLGGLAGGFIVATALEQSGRLKGPARELVGLLGFVVVVVAAIVLISSSGRFCDPVAFGPSGLGCP